MNLASPKPLAGIRVLDLSALGPGPFASRLLADYGAEVVMVEQPAVPDHDTNRGYGRGKKSIVLDLKAPGATQFVLGIVDKFDVLIESMRPGKMEALGLGPRKVAERAPRLIYTRLTAFGQTGPLAQKAGHDINAIAIAGSLSLCGKDQPLPPYALLGDYAGGSMMVVIGVLLALIERQQSGRGRVVNASMTDGATLLAGSMINGVKSGQKGPQKGAEIIDGTRPFYTTYRCADGNWMAVGAVEPKFFREVIRGLNLEGVVDPRDQMNPAKAAFIHKQFADKFLEKTRDEWERDFANIDACVSPVLELGELASHPHHQHGGTAFLSSNGNVEVGIVPRIEGVDHTPGSPSPARGADTKSVMSAYGISEQAQQAAIAAGIVRI